MVKFRLTLIAVTQELLNREYASKLYHVLKNKNNAHLLSIIQLPGQIIFSRLKLHF